MIESATTPLHVGLRMLRPSALGILLLSSLTAGCADAGGESALDARIADLEDRFTPGLHTLMGEVGQRHAMLWFAGDAENWPLADYQLHEIEELIENIESLHPVYDGVPVAELLTETTRPPLDAVEAAVDAGDVVGFRQAFDGLTQGCNSCHIASDRAALAIVRPTAPPVTNLDFSP
ncbi:MAG: hypothetical protein WEA34_12495 [Gemmatimonadota bacterium]